MAFNPQSGILGSVTLGTAVFAMDKWKVDYKTNLPKVNNFTSPFQQLVPGLKMATVTLSGPYDAGNMAIAVGQFEAIVKLSVNNALAYTVSGYVESVGLEDGVEDAARINITIQSSGSFVPDIT